MRHYILNDADEPVQADDILTWGRWMGQADDHRRVGRTALPGGVIVSTVFLGLDYSFLGGPPVLWETMIFGGKHDGFQERYTSLPAAREGHRRAVRLATRSWFLRQWDSIVALARRLRRL